MTRSIVSGLVGLISVVAMGILPTACESGGVGDPCVPEDEYNTDFAGFKVTEENIESRSFQCQTRICLVNHFQGRVSCPLGQSERKPCTGPMDTASCGEGESCVESATISPDCDPESDACKSYVCHTLGNCQIAGADEGDNTGKACCVPGTDTPVALPVCGQCAPDSNRNAEKAVYCSCRCGVAEGEPTDENFNFCECPNGFECQEIRKNVGLGDKQITGKYCIKQGSVFETEQKCGQVSGYYNSQQCKGIGLGG